MTDHPNDILAAAVNILLGPVLDLIQVDPHHWSTRPCPTCRTVSALVQRPFGCELYRQQRAGKP